MLKLVVLSEGFAGRSYELATVLTTVGRLDDNSFEIPEPSVSSHHCEIMLRGSEVIIEDLNSTNGTFVNGERIEGEAIIKPGQVIRLGQVDMRLEGDEAIPTPFAPSVSPMPAPTPAAAPSKKPLDRTATIPQGVSLTQMDQGTKTITFDKNSPFAKRSNRGTKLFIIGAIIIGMALFGVIIYIIFFQSPTM